MSRAKEKILISEILPSPKGPDSQEEWIEIFNSSEFEIDLSGWKIQDMAGKTKTYIFPKETKIPTKGFLILKRPMSKIVLNNDGDGLRLIDLKGEIIDEVSYQRAEKGKSYNRVNSNWVWSENLTPGTENILVQREKFLEERGLATINQPISKEVLPSPFLIALALAIFSGIIILILKRILNKNLMK